MRDRDSARRSERANILNIARPIYVYVKVHGTHNSNISSIPHYLICIPANMYWRMPMICAELRERLTKQTNAYVKFHCCIKASKAQIPSTTVMLPPPVFFHVLPFSPHTIPFKGMLVVTFRRLEPVRTLQKYTEV
jgi:hypothetical protein